MLNKSRILTIIMMFSLLLTACNNSTPQQEEKLPEQPPLVQEEQQPPVKAEPVPFAYEEINSIFSMQEKDVLAIYGEPKEILESSYWEDSLSKEYVFEENHFGFVCYGEEKESYLYFAYLADNLIRAPRDIEVGMALADVLALFPNNSQDKDFYLMEGYAENEVAEYQILYGEYMYMEQYAILIYQNDEVVEVEYADQGGVMRLHIKEDKVVSIEYMISLM